jgi:hypothetical protein
MASTHKSLRSGTANKRPTTSIADGQIALNTNVASPGLYFKDSTGASIIKIGPVHVGTTAPNVAPAGSSGNSTGEAWLDTSLTPNGWKVWTGAAWVNATPAGSATVQGLLELATNAETQAGSDTARAVTPAGLQSKVSDSTSTTSSTTIASSTAVKSAYDLANAALPKSGGTVTGNLEIGTSGSLTFEGATADAFETTLAVVDPTADRTITLPNVTGTVVTTGDTGSVTSTMILDGTILNTDVNASAAIAGTKISPDFGSQNAVTTGTSTAASFIPSSSTTPTNGLYLSAANQVSLATGSTERLRLDSTGQIKAVSIGSAAAPTYTFTTDSNTGVYSLGADQLNLATAGVDRLSIDATGEVGIGTTSPGAKLHISGTAPIFRLTDTDTSVDHRISGSSTVGTLSIETDYLSTGTAPVFLVSIQGTEKMRFSDTSGCLALGSATTSGGGSGTSIRFANVITGATTSVSVLGSPAVQSDVTANARIYVSAPSTVASGFTLSNLQHFYAAPAAFGAGSAVTNQYGFAVSAGLSEATNNYGFFCPALTGTTTAYGFYSSIASATGRYNFYAGGTAANYFAGSVGIATASPLGFLHIETPATTAGWQIRLDSVGLANESGFYRSATDNYEMVLRNGLGGLSYLTNTGGASTSTLEFNVQGSERARIDSSGRLLVGTSATVSTLVDAGLQVQGTGANAYISTGRWNNTASSSALIFNKSRGASVGTRAVVQSGDVIGEIIFTGDDGTAFVRGASIFAQVDGTPGTDDMPGRLIFNTTADGASTSTERLRITSDGVIAYDQPAPATYAAAATLTVADLKIGIITYTGTAATLTLPTGTLTEGGFSGIYTNMAFEWSVINTGAGICTIGAATAHTIVGTATVAIGASARFTSRRTAANTFISYRLA